MSHEILAISIERPTGATFFRAIVFDYTNENEARIVDVLESIHHDYSDFEDVWSLAVERNPTVSCVRAPDGSLDSGDGLSLKEVAEIVFADVIKGV